MNSLIYLWLGGCIFLAIYHLFVYIGRRQDKSKLAFFLWTLCMCVFIFFEGYFNSPHVINKNNLFNILPFNYHIMFGSQTYLLLCILKYPEKKRNIFLLMFLGLTIIIAIVYIIFFIFNSFIPFYFYLIPLEISIITTTIYYIYYLLKSKDIKKKEKIILFCILFLVQIPLFFDNLLIMFGNRLPLLIGQIFSVLIFFSLAYIITSSFNKEYANLLELKDTLEQKVTDRTLLLQEAKEKIEKTSKEKINFFVNIAHELKTPLTLMNNFLADDIKKRGNSNDIEIVKYNLNKINKDIINSLDLQKIDNNSSLYNHDQIINLSYLVNIISNMYKNITLKKNIELLTDIDDNFYIKINTTAAERIINNLLDNAIKYTDSGKIIITLKEKNKIIYLSIKDTGIGITEEHQKNIFKPYYQISSKKSNIQGLGMGLNIVKNILDEIKSSIEVKSKLNQGTEFIIKFNKYDLKENDAVIDNNINNNPIIIPNLKLKEEEYDNSKKNIFIIEDNIQMLSYLQKSLLKYHNIFYAVNGEEALHKIKWIPKPDIILSDIMMDKMDGFEFYEELMKRKKYYSIPFIFITAKIDINEKLKAFKYGAIDFITKPFIIDELIAKINSILNLKKSLRENNMKNFMKKIGNMLVESEENDFQEKYEKYKILQKEKEVIELLTKGHEYKNIAYKLNLSESAIKKRIRNIYKKCGVQNKIELLNLLNEN